MKYMRHNNHIGNKNSRLRQFKGFEHKKLLAKLPEFGLIPAKTLHVAGRLSSKLWY